MVLALGCRLQIFDGIFFFNFLNFAWRIRKTRNDGRFLKL